MKTTHGLLLALVAMAAWPAGSVATTDDPIAHAAATCSDYPNQKAAQEAADTRDADGDGIYCEDLPCPCSTEAGGGKWGGGSDRGGGSHQTGCTKPNGIKRLVFSKAKYPNIRRHFRAAVRKGWPTRLVVNRRGADARRDRLLEGYPTKDGYDRDEYPPAVGRGKGKGLMRGRNPRGWRASVRYVPSSENRSHGAVLGNKIDDLCNGARFRYVFR
jgi:hypothetical protein